MIDCVFSDVEKQISGLTSIELYELSEVIKIFTSGFKPTVKSSDWILQFRTNFDYIKIFKWVGFLDRLIDLPFASRSFREKSQVLAVLLENAFHRIDLNISIESILFVFVGLFYQVIATNGLIYLNIRQSPSKLGAILRLDTQLSHKVVIDMDSSIIGVIPGYQAPIEILEQIIEEQIFDIQWVEIFIEYLDQLPIQVNSLRKIRIHQFEVTGNRNLPLGENITYFYH